jgi:hypothetical protein
VILLSFVLANGERAKTSYYYYMNLVDAKNNKHQVPLYLRFYKVYSKRTARIPRTEVYPKYANYEAYLKEIFIDTDAEYLISRPDIYDIEDYIRKISRESQEKLSYDFMFFLRFNFTGRAADEEEFLRSMRDENNLRYCLDFIYLKYENRRYLWTIFSRELYENILRLIFANSDWDFAFNRQDVQRIKSEKPPRYMYTPARTYFDDERSNAITIMVFSSERDEELTKYWLADIKADLPEQYWDVLENPEKYIARTDFFGMGDRYEGYIVTSNYSFSIISKNVELLDGKRF